MKTFLIFFFFFKLCLLKHLTLFNISPPVNPQKLSNQSVGGQPTPEHDQPAPSLATETACVSEKENKTIFLLRDGWERNSSERQLRPMSTREELQAEHVAQVT